MQAAEASRKKRKKTITGKGGRKLVLEFFSLGDWRAAMKLVTAIKNLHGLLLVLAQAHQYRHRGLTA